MVQLKWDKIKYSHWFYYLLIGITLLFCIFVIFPILLACGIIDRDLHLNLFSEFVGLLVTLILFTMLLEGTKLLDWRKVESKVKWRIGWEIYGIFDNVLNLCEVKTTTGGAGRDISAWKDAKKRQLEEVTKGKIVLSELGMQVLEDSKLAKSYAEALTTSKNNLSNFELKYYRFFSSDVQCSLMDIQIEIEKILMEIWRSEFLKTKDRDRLTKSAEKIMKEIANLSENGIGVGL
jgi:hypothetical protein